MSLQGPIPVEFGEFQLLLLAEHLRLACWTGKDRRRQKPRSHQELAANGLLGVLLSAHG
jgi:hypothetical protein